MADNLDLMVRFLHCTRLAMGGDPPPPDGAKLAERDLQPWPGNEDGTRPEGRGIWSANASPSIIDVLATIPQDEEEPGFVYRRFRVYDADENLIAEGDGLFHTGVEWSWTEPLGFASQQWNASDIRFFEKGAWSAH